MDRQAFIEMLNKDLADEHASILRYLIHAYQVGETTPFGEMLLSTAREEMWHMDWLGDEIGEQGEEPLMEKGIYPYDGASNASLLRSYIEWEAGLVKMYAEQADQVEERELKRVLNQLGWESVTHQRRFEMWLEKLGPQGEEPLLFDEPSFSPDMIVRFHTEVDAHYKLVLQHLRQAFVLGEPVCPVGSELELTAMRHMKNMSHFAEEVADAGEELPFDYPGVDLSSSPMSALTSDLALTEEAQERLIAFSQDPEIAKHESLKVEIDNIVTRDGLLTTVLKELMETAEEAEPEAASSNDELTVGSLK